MKLFITKYLLFISMFTVTIWLLTFVPKESSKNDYMSGMVQKHERLKAVKSPRIILGAGSNMAFGINSQLIEKEFSLPVVNLSIHAGLGVTFILNELKNAIDSGDVVFLSLEYFLSLKGDDQLKKRASIQFKEAAEYYKMSTIEEVYLLAEETKRNSRNKIRYLLNPGLSKMSMENAVYHKNAFNKYGDVISHFKTPPKGNLKGKGQMIYRYWDAINEINEFYKHAQNMGVTVFYLFPTYPESLHKKNHNEIKLLEKDLDNDMEIEIINTPSSFVYPDSLFFDTVYHLNEDGTKKRTMKFIDLIKMNETVMKSINK